MIFLKFFFNYFVTVSITIIGLSTDPPENISRGRYARIQKFPYQASLRRNPNIFFCSGVIITKQHILTAAHCIEGENVMDTFVVVGTNNLESRGFRTEIKKMVKHPNFLITKYNVRDDIGVITLKRKLDNRIPFWKRIPLLGKDIKNGDEAVISGWGQTKQSKIYHSITLQYIRAKLTNSSKCKKEFGLPLSSTKQVCIYPVKGKNTCSGDSGSPVVVRSKLSGIVSFGSNCDIDPSIFVNVYAFRDFIQQETKRSLRYLLGKLKPKRRTQHELTNFRF